MKQIMQQKISDLEKTNQPGSKQTSQTLIYWYEGF